MSTKIFTLAGVSLALLASGEAMAQSRPAASAPARAAAAPPVGAPATISHGPAIPGVCLVNIEAAIAQSSVGQYMRTRLQQLTTQVQSELQPEQTQIVSDEKAFDAQRASLDQATLQTRGQALQARINAFEQKAQLRQREMEATQEKALNRVGQELDPVLRQVYVQRRCSVLFRAPGYVLANPDMDLTAASVAGLNAKITQFPIDREHLDTGAAAPAR